MYFAASVDNDVMRSPLLPGRRVHANYSSAIGTPGFLAHLAVATYHRRQFPLPHQRRIRQGLLLGAATFAAAPSGPGSLNPAG